MLSATTTSKFKTKKKLIDQNIINTLNLAKLHKRIEHHTKAEASSRRIMITEGYLEAKNLESPTRHHQAAKRNCALMFF